MVETLESIICGWYTTGWWLTYPSEKCESQLGLLFPVYVKIKHVPNHQPEYSGRYKGWFMTTATLSVIAGGEWWWAVDPKTNSYTKCEWENHVSSYFTMNCWVSNVQTKPYRIMKMNVRYPLVNRHKNIKQRLNITIAMEKLTNFQSFQWPCSIAM